MNHDQSDDGTERTILRRPPAVLRAGSTETPARVRQIVKDGPIGASDREWTAFVGWDEV